MSKYTINRLDNDLEYLVLDIPDSLTFTLTIGIKVGSINETPELNGISHLLEHMLFKGNRLFESKYDLYNELDRLGAVYNAYTDKNKTVFFIKAHYKHQSRVIEIFSSLICEPEIDVDDLENEKKVVIEEIKNNSDEVMNSVYNRFFKLMYNNDEPIVKTISGTVEDIERITHANVLKHLRQFYNAQNMAVAIVGRIDPNIHEFMKASSFEKAIQGERTPKNKILKPINKTVIDFVNKPIKQMVMSIGFPTRGIYDRRRYEEDIINGLLTGGMSSRLFVNLREKNGLVYSVSAMKADFEEAGLYFIITTFDGENYDKVLENILEQLVELQTRDVSDEEFEKIKTAIVSKMVIDIEDNSDVADYYVNEMLFFRDDITSFNELLEKYEGITKDQVRETANWLFNWKRMKIVMVGNFMKDGKEKVNKVLSILKTKYGNKNT